MLRYIEFVFHPLCGWFVFHEIFDIDFAVLFPFGILFEKEYN